MSVYDVNLFLHDLAGSVELRSAIEADGATALERYEMDDRERGLIVTGDVGELHRMGVNDFLLYNLARFSVFGLDSISYSERMRATADDQP